MQLLHVASSNVSTTIVKHDYFFREHEFRTAWLNDQRLNSVVYMNKRHSLFLPKFSMLPLKQTKNPVGKRASSGTVPNTSSRQFEKKMYLILSGLGSLFLLNIVRAVPQLDVAKVKPIWTILKGNRVTFDFVGIYIC